MHKRKTSEEKNEAFDKVLELYNFDMPKYLKIVNKNKIKIRASEWEGVKPRWITITPKDVAKYYGLEAGNISSGARTISNFTSDWRLVDAIARESLDIFKVLNKDALKKEGKKYGLELKE